MNPYTAVTKHIFHMVTYLQLVEFATTTCWNICFSRQMFIICAMQAYAKKTGHVKQLRALYIMYLTPPNVYAVTKVVFVFKSHGLVPSHPIILAYEKMYQDCCPIKVLYRRSWTQILGFEFISHLYLTEKRAPYSFCSLQWWSQAFRGQEYFIYL